MVSTTKKQKLRRLLATISPEDKPELLVGGLEDEIKDLASRLSGIKDYSNAIAELQYNLQSLKNTLISKLENLPDKNTLLEVKKNYLEQLAETQTKLKTLSDKVDDELGKGQTKTANELKNALAVLEKWRTDILLHLPRGGNMNRQIRVDGTDVLTRYTDMNLKAGSGMSLSAADDNTNKRVDVTFAVSGLGTSIVTPVETPNGVITAFTVSSQPKLVFVDGGRAVQATSSDGTVNWTYAGTALTLTVAPVFDIFCLI